MTDPNQTPTPPSSDATAAAPVTTSPQAQQSAPSFEQLASESINTQSAGEPEVTQTPTEDIVVGYLKKRGVEVPEGETGEQILDRITNSYATLEQQYRQVQPVVHEYQSNADRFREWMASQQSQQYQQPAAPQQPQGSGVPEWNPAWDKYVRLDPETGRYIPADQYANPTLAEKANAFADYRKEFFNKFAASPKETLKQHVEDLVQEQLAAARQQWEAENYQKHEQGQFQEMVRADAKLLFQHDSNGNPLRDQLGNPVQTPVGQAVFAFMRQEQEAGIQSHTLAYQRAIQQVELLQHRWMMAQQQQPAATAPQQPAQETTKKNDPSERPRDEYGRFLPEQRKSEFIETARQNGRGPTGQRNQSVATAARMEIAQNESLDFKQMALEELGQRGKGPLAAKYNA